MQAKRKRSRASIGGGVSADLLSALPDCLLHHIMSFMKARQVVQTCVLSKRWEHLWRTVPCLDVDQREFHRTDDQSARYEHEAWQDFEDFADSLMLRLKIAHLDTFRLQVSDVITRGMQAARWIRRGIKYGAKVDGIRREGLSSSSWRIKRLHLSNVCLDDRFAKHIRLGCHSLEDLELKGCTFQLDEITSHSLKNLVIHEGYRDRKYQLIVMAPAMASLCLAFSFYRLRGGICVSEMPSITSASIHVQGDYGYGVSSFNGNQCQLLGSLCNATRLELSGFQTMVVPKEPVKLPEFKNLKTLSLRHLQSW